jgi:hypothetical protein
MSCGKLIGDVNDRSTEYVKCLKERFQILAKTANIYNMAVKGKFSTLQTKIRR